jgi:hypothetical protein
MLADAAARRRDDLSPAPGHRPHIFAAAASGSPAEKKYFSRNNPEDYW